MDASMEAGGQTSVFGVRDEVENEAKAYRVPLGAVFLGIHEQKVLLHDRRVLRVEVYGRHVYPPPARGIVIRFEGPHFE